MRAVILLCDWAEVIAGKLYAQGVGWARTRADTPGIGSAVATLLYVPYDQTNRRVAVTCRLVTADGQPFPEQQPAQFGYEFEIGRPPGLQRGAEQIMPFAAKVNGIIYPPGDYEWVLEVDGATVAGAPFSATKE
ncbi:MAG: hypothetical protein DLM56_10870 [Pseudonocardiales bacterium]|nr:MAG: hypothetical protein DLM56_10870 [Pseudonocardiales bacterium]